MDAKNVRKCKPVKRKKIVVQMLLILIAAVSFGIINVLSSEKEGKITHTLTPSFSVEGGESGSVLDPEKFTGTTRNAYGAAKTIPQVLDKLYCYCYCENRPFNHKSLLSCFTEYHGAT